MIISFLSSLHRQKSQLVCNNAITISGAYPTQFQRPSDRHIDRLSSRFACGPVPLAKCTFCHPRARSCRQMSGGGHSRIYSPFCGLPAGIYFGTLGHAIPQHNLLIIHVCKSMTPERCLTLPQELWPVVRSSY